MTKQGKKQHRCKKDDVVQTKAYIRIKQNDKQIEFYLVRQHINLHCREILAMIKQTKEHRDQHSSRKQQQQRAKTCWHKKRGRLLDPNT